MPNGRKRVRGTFAASILLAASLAAAPALAGKPPPPPPPPLPDPSEVCFPWGSVIWGVDCCPIYPQLCEDWQPPEEAVLRPEDAGSSGQ